MIAEKAGVRGCFRIKIVNADGKFAGDSGWYENQVVDLGFNQYLVSGLGGIGGSKQITHMVLGTGSQPGAAHTSLEGELDETNSRSAVTAATSSGSKTLRLTATFASSSSFVSATMNISNIALYNTSTATVGTLFAGNTFASSSCATNQAVNATYDIIFS